MSCGDQVYIYAGHYAGRHGRVQAVWRSSVRVRIHDFDIGNGPKVVNIEHHEVRPVSAVDRLARLAKLGAA